MCTLSAARQLLVPLQYAALAVIVTSCIRSNSSRSVLHPFRDGDTRTQRLFFHQLTTEAGWLIDWHAINANMDQLKHARLIAHAGNHEPIRDVLAPTLHPAGQSRTAGGVAGLDLTAQIRQLRSAAFPRPSKEATQKPSTTSSRRRPPALGREAQQNPGLE